MTRVLIVEDDEPNSSYAELVLRHHGYEVVIAMTGAAALLAVESTTIDVILLDIGLPDVDGIEACRRLRTFTDVPIIFVSGRTDEAAKVRGLDAGGDDFVTKPFSVAELTARIRAVLRRPGRDAAGSTDRLEAGGIVLDLASHRIIAPDGEVSLTPREFDLLRLLMAEDGRVVSRQHILDTVWGPGFVGDDNVLDVHMSQLRRKLEKLGAPWCGVQTVRGVGYCFSRL